MVGQRQQATMAYRLQVYGYAERLVQTLTRSNELYVSNVGHRDWDEYAERLTFVINTAQAIVRKETPICLIHGWDATSTLEAKLQIVNTRLRESDLKGRGIVFRAIISERKHR